MRLVVWNCCERFDRNFFNLVDLDFDVAVVSEAGLFDPGLGADREVTSVSELGVDQPGHTKRLGVFARYPWSVQRMPRPVDQPWGVPARVTGPLEFTVLAFWALGPGWVDGQSYTRQARRVIAELLPNIEGPVVMAGDFNAPLPSGPSEARAHAENVAALGARGLVSAFTATRAGADPLTEPTLYWQWKASQPFHVDHAFVPDRWQSTLALQIGNYDEWVAAGRSDHVPLILDWSQVPTGI